MEGFGELHLPQARYNFFGNSWIGIKSRLLGALKLKPGEPKSFNIMFRNQLIFRSYPGDGCEQNPLWRDKDETQPNDGC